MKIVVNKTNEALRINEAFEDAVNQIKKNAENGISNTDIYVDKNIAYEVRKKLENEVENIYFQIIRTARNNYTGNMDSFTGETIGENRHYRVTILN